MAGLPQLDDGLFLTDGGLETDLIFHHGIALPEFAAFVLHEHAAGEALLRDYYREYFRIGARAGLGVIVETATWRASPSWGSKLGYDGDRLRSINERAAAFLLALRDDEADGTVVVSGSIGPRGDAYFDLGPASADEALVFHRPQVAALAGSGVDLVSALTLTNVDEAIGFLRAAIECKVPAVVSFTVEVDGRLPSGMDLVDAIDLVDAETDSAATHFMVNCAHLDHFKAQVSAPHGALRRVRGVRANASRLSHAELDDSTELDDGDPSEFGNQLVALHQMNDRLTILGGCCGTDARHIASIAQAYGSDPTIARQRSLDERQTHDSE
ncbi:MAG: homocysteine S-methyltransferase family protein [Ilumatobacteraceae bacterium]